jgi:hypothetical protein
MEIKNIADNLTEFKIALKQFLYFFFYFIHWKTASIMNYVLCITKTAYYIAISFEVVLQYTVSLYIMIWSPCINLISYLCTVFMRLLFVFYLHDFFIFYCAYCHSKDTFYIHFVGSLYWINEREDLQPPTRPKRMCLYQLYISVIWRCIITMLLFWAGCGRQNCHVPSICTRRINLASGFISHFFNHLPSPTTPEAIRITVINMIIQLFSIFENEDPYLPLITWSRFIKQNFKIRSREQITLLTLPVHMDTHKSALT